MTVQDIQNLVTYAYDYIANLGEESYSKYINAESIRVYNQKARDVYRCIRALGRFEKLDYKDVEMIASCLMKKIGIEDLPLSALFDIPDAIQYRRRYVYDNQPASTVTETDPTVPSWVKDISSVDISNWDTAYGWGDHSLAGYITAETDPTVGAHIKAITITDVANWNTAYGWGDHALAGYLTVETDPTVGAHIKAITSGQIANWDAVFANAIRGATNLGGTGLFTSVAGTNIQLKGIAAGSSKTNIGSTATTVTVDVNEGNLTHDNLSGVDANEHVDHTTVSISAGLGLTGGGDISANRTIALDHLGIQNLVDPGITGVVIGWNDVSNQVEWVSGTSAIWGSITGTLSNQLDLQAALDAKEPVFGKNTAFNKDFAGTGSATTVARSDHDHLADGDYWLTAGTTTLLSNATIDMGSTDELYIKNDAGNTDIMFWGGTYGTGYYGGLGVGNTTSFNYGVAWMAAAKDATDYSELLIYHNRLRLQSKKSGSNQILDFTTGGRILLTDPLLKGIEYAGTGYVTQLHSLADKEYVDTAVGGVVPGGSNSQVQYNDGGVFGGAIGFVWDDINSRVGIGTSAPISPLHVGTVPASALYAVGDQASVFLSQYDTYGGFSVTSTGTHAYDRGTFAANRANGTLASPTAVALNDEIFAFLGRGYDGTILQSTASIIGYVDGSVSSGVVPQRISFLTSPTNTAGILERFVIKSDGKIWISTLPATGDASDVLLLRDATNGEITKLGIGTNLSVSGGNLNASGGTIGGTIAVDQVAYATSADTIGGDADFLFDGTNWALRSPSASTPWTFHYQVGGSGDTYRDGMFIGEANGDYGVLLQHGPSVAGNIPLVAGYIGTATTDSFNMRAYLPTVASDTTGGVNVWKFTAARWNGTGYEALTVRDPFLFSNWGDELMALGVDHAYIKYPLEISENAAPGTPATGRGVIYEKTDQKLYFKNATGTEYDLTKSSYWTLTGSDIYRDSNVGINTSGAPSVPLHIKYVSGLVNILRLEGSSAGNVGIDFYTSTTLRAQVENHFSSPRLALQHLYGPVTLYGGNSGSAVGVVNATYNGTAFITGTSGFYPASYTHTIHVDGTNGIGVDSTGTNYFMGDIGVGTDSPSSGYVDIVNRILRVRGGGSAIARHSGGGSTETLINVQSSSGASRAYFQISSDTTSPLFYMSNSSGTNTMLLRGSGTFSFGANTAVTSGYIMELFGSNNKGRAADWYATSDRRLKENIAPYGNVLSRISKMSEMLVTYNRIGEDRIELGFIAQDVLPLFPEIVGGSEKEMYDISYGRVGAIALQGVAEVNKKVEKLENEVHRLKKIIYKFLG